MLQDLRILCLLVGFMKIHVLPRASANQTEVRRSNTKSKRSENKERAEDVMRLAKFSTDLIIINISSSYEKSIFL